MIGRGYDLLIGRCYLSDWMMGSVSEHNATLEMGAISTAVHEWAPNMSCSCVWEDFIVIFAQKMQEITGQSYLVEQKQKQNGDGKGCVLCGKPVLLTWQLNMLWRSPSIRDWRFLPLILRC